MVTTDPVAPKEREISLTITVRVESIGQAKALELDNAIRDLADDYGAEVFSNQSTPRVLNGPR